jgi:spore germination protein GerM
MLCVMEKKLEDGTGHRWLLYAWLILIVVLLIMVLLTLPSIVRSLESSQMIELVRNHLDEQKPKKESPEENKTTVSVVFPIPMPGSSFRFQVFPTTVVGSRLYHETVEAVLAGPSAAALSQGAVSCIPIGTSLIGLTVSTRVAYIDLSKEFLNDTVWGEIGFDASIEQLRRTMRMFDAIKDIVILIEGSLLEPFPGGLQ